MALTLLGIGACTTSKKMSKSILPGIDITFTGDQVADTVFVTITPIPSDTTLYVMEYVEAMENGPTKAYPVKDRSVHIFPESVPSIYKLACDFYSMPSYYLRSSDHLDMTINSLGPARYKATGGIYSNKIPYSDKFYKLVSKLYKISRYKLTENELDSLSNEMNLLIDQIMSESDPETATRVVTRLEDDFVSYAFSKLPPGSEKTLYYTYACSRRNSSNRSENQQKMLEQSLETAPSLEISLNSLDGQTFNLSSLRGKWVVIDFWATWCGPCKRGFKNMKKVYAENSDRLEVVAIACGDHEDTWQASVNEQELPWINLLAPAPGSHDGTVAGFPISAYPTKLIIDPEGRLIDYSIGEDEEFYTKLEKLIK